MDSRLQRLWQKHNQIIRLGIVSVVLIFIFVPIEQFYGSRASAGSNAQNDNVNVQQEIKQNNKCTLHTYECINHGRNSVTITQGNTNAKIQTGQHISQLNQCGQSTHCINNAKNNINIKSNNLGHINAKIQTNKPGHGPIKGPVLSH